jgi:hypothetical protein
MNSLVMGMILGTIYLGQTDTQESAKNIMGLFFLIIMFQTMVSMFGVLQVRGETGPGVVTAEARKKGGNREERRVLVPYSRAGWLITPLTSCTFPSTGVSLGM